ncbi:hypothetical protein C7S14_6802 [Burkholderia cepacia]|nr:hypothetical protein C7S14_6802 [Burkholderia cepacia]
MRHGLPSPWVAGRTAYACRRGAGTPAGEKCRNPERVGRRVLRARRVRLAERTTGA